ncbi:MAG TPA: hypothetical protein VLE53_13145 [Gemmatimonadaceae bacterium]|nr:hypothetical protein [Gemmatimonadaceae bacterium]
MAKRRVGPLRGRARVALALAGFLAVTTSVVWRRSVGTAHARRLDELVSRHAALLAQRAELESEVQRLSSRVQLTPVVERLGMRVPRPDQVIDLPRPDGPGPGGR